MASKALAGWHEIVKTRDPGGLDALLADDVVFHSPVVHTPQRGKAITVKYLTAALAVLGENFRYVEEWTESNSAVLEFITAIDGVEVNGVDIIGWNAEGENRPLQGHGAAVEGDPDPPAAHGGGARGVMTAAHPGFGCYAASSRNKGS